MIEHACGLEYHWHGLRIFFGNKESALANLKTEFPELRFLRMRQVHGNRIQESTLETPDFQIEADGHITRQSGLALCSISADCVPVLMACSDSGWIGAFHAGWRGVAGRLIPLGIESLLAKGGLPQNLRIWIGPHILQDSFEVHADVRDQILRSLPPANLESTVASWESGQADAATASLYCYEDPLGQFRMSLLQILLEQISAVGVPLENVEMELDDTRSNLAYHSARRDREKSGRQISWIAIQDSGPKSVAP